MIEFDLETTVYKHYKVTPSIFVNKYLKAIRKYENEYDFYVQSNSRNGFLERVFMLPKSKFKLDITKFEADKEVKKHIIKVLKETYEENK